MTHSDAIDALAAALAAAQGECKPVAFDRDNPFFHSRYATLAALWAEIRPVFARHGLSIIQGADERGAIETTTAAPPFLWGGIVLVALSGLPGLWECRLLVATPPPRGVRVTCLSSSATIKTASLRNCARRIGRGFTPR